ncbi:hypothetical protein M0805_001563 [Coniferiporia weirii]|nr:hypothetical protein M0805_001563 [Coniferiporia weirii]
MLRAIRRPLGTSLSSSRSPPSSIVIRRQGLLSPGSKHPVNDDQPQPSPSLPPEEESDGERQRRTPMERTLLRRSRSSPLPYSLLMAVDVAAMKRRVYEWTMKNATRLRLRMDDFSETARIAFAQLGGRLNEVTGYREIEALKKLVVENENKMHEIREAARAAKTSYEDAVARRSSSQRELNDLLQRKSGWGDTDVMRFTELVRADHAHELAEARARTATTNADSAVERQFGELMRTILARYHEEQVWSDKIRSASTYGSLAALGLNLVVFVLAIVLVEPWKRKKLVQSFERRVMELNEANQRVVADRLGDLQMHQETQERLLSEIWTGQTRLTQTAVAPAPTSGDRLNKTEAGSVAPSLNAERNTKATRDRRMLIISTAGVLGTGIVGFLLGYCLH